MLAGPQWGFITKGDAAANENAFKEKKTKVGRIKQVFDPGNFFLFLNQIKYLALCLFTLRDMLVYCQL